MSVNILKAGQEDWRAHRNLFPFIVQIGTGGTGGYVTQHLAQMLGVSNKPAAYVIADPDVIETKNLGNQLFLKEEVGLPKADVLASRYSEAYGFNIGSYSESYIESVKDIQDLFSKEYMNLPTSSYSNTLLLPILVVCVDNVFTRKICHDFFLQTKSCIYIDAGNEATKVPSDWQTRVKKDWTEEEITTFNDSGWSGQVVTGVKLNSFYQAPVMEMFPEMLEDNDSIRKPSELSCTELTASEPQRLIVNKFAALAIANILTHIVEENEITTHISFFHAKKCYFRSTLATSEKNEEDE